MVRLRTASGVVGALAGVVALAGTLYGGIGREPQCSPDPCIVHGPNLFVIALAALLALNSIVGLVGPSLVFYGSGALSVFLGASMLPNSSFADPWVLTAIALVIASFALSLLAARRQSRISEQSHPMNLPVFG